MKRYAGRIALLAGIAAFGLLVLVGVLPKVDMPQSAMDPQGPIARQLDNLIRPVFYIAAGVFVFVEGLILYTVFRYRARTGDERPKQIHGNTKFELGWTVAPAVVLAVIGFLTVGTIIDLSRSPEGDDVVRVDVIGHQWWWEYVYNDVRTPSGQTVDVVTANELHIPEDTPVELTLTSEDVIHNYWPPKLAGKVYAIPGREAKMTIQADRVGYYYGECAEYCGLSHANMRLRVQSQTREEFAAWAEAQAQPAPTPDPTSIDQAGAVAGQEIFLAKGCGGCHAITGVAAGNVGPDLTHLYDRKTFAGAIFETNATNLRRWIRNAPVEKPGSVMPSGEQLGLTEDDITALIAYLQTLRTTGPNTPSEPSS